MTGSINGMKVSVSLPTEDVEFLDGYTASHALQSRSAAVQRAVRALRIADLADAYDGAWREWASSDDAPLWDATAGDGL